MRWSMPASASSCSTTCPPGLLRAAEADAADRRRRRRSGAGRRDDRGPRGRGDHPFRRLDHRSGIDENPLGYYGNNTVNSRTLIEAAVKGGVRHFIFSSTAAVYGNPARVPVSEDDPTVPALALRLVEADDRGDAARRQRRARSRPCRAALLQRRRRRPANADRPVDAGRDAPHQGRGRDRARPPRTSIDVYGTDYPTPDGTCIRDFIHVSDLARAHLAR